MSHENKTVERLTELLDTKDRELDKLQEKLSELENTIEYAPYYWCIPKEVDNDHPDLPLPRLECLWYKHDYEDVCVYRLLYTHLLGHTSAVFLGRTRKSSSYNVWPPKFKGKLDFPHRDGAHIHHDAVHMNLPAYVICEDIVEELDLTEKSDYLYQIKEAYEHSNRNSD